MQMLAAHVLIISSMFSNFPCFSQIFFGQLLKLPFCEEIIKKTLPCILHSHQGGIMLRLHYSYVPFVDGNMEIFVFLSESWHYFIEICLNVFCLPPENYNIRNL